jgi:hypothetical protein
MKSALSITSKGKPVIIVRCGSYSGKQALYGAIPVEVGTVLMPQEKAPATVST